MYIFVTNRFFNSLKILSLHAIKKTIMSLQELLSAPIQNAVEQLFQISMERIEFQSTKKDFEGDITMVVFPLVKQIKGNPVEIGTKIGEYLVENVAEVAKFNVVAGFLNLVISDKYYLEYFNSIKNTEKFGFLTPKEGEKAIMVEYSSPNTNKPLHLGHVRNNLLGYSVAEIIKASGKKVYKTQIINDRGIHICKSMLAWKLYGNGETPESTGLKGDHFVGKYYVIFDQKYKEIIEKIELKADNEYQIRLNELNATKTIEEIVLTADYVVDTYINTSFKAASFFYDELKSENSQFHFDINKVIDYTVWKTLNYEKFNKLNEVKEEFNKLNENPYLAKKIIFEELKKINPLLQEAQQMLLDWENGKPEVIELWKTMNQWVYDGFDETYKNLGVDFDVIYKESITYLLGKDVVEEGLNSGVFFRKEDGSVWIDLTADGLDEKIVLRSDGTSVYMTQDIGTAIQRVRDFSDIGGMVYTVGNEQDYHFKVLFLILKKLGYDWSQHLFHLSYGMVELPTGKMKSREGTVVDADDLMEEMTATAQQISEDLGKL